MAPGATEDPALPAVTIKALLALHAKRTRDMFAGDANKPVPLDEIRRVYNVGPSLKKTPPSTPSGIRSTQPCTHLAPHAFRSCGSL